MDRATSSPSTPPSRTSVINGCEQTDNTLMFALKSKGILETKHARFTMLNH
jgi:hypothetical protein